MSIPKGVPLGARVKYIGNNPEIKGEEETIIKFWSDCVLVEFDNPIPFPYGHDGRSVGEWCGKDGHCRWFSLENEGLVVIPTIDDTALNALLLD